MGWGEETLQGLGLASVSREVREGQDRNGLTWLGYFSWSREMWDGQDRKSWTWQTGWVNAGWKNGVDDGWTGLDAGGTGLDGPLHRLLIFKRTTDFWPIAKERGGAFVSFVHEESASILHEALISRLPGKPVGGLGPAEPEAGGAESPWVTLAGHSPQQGGCPGWDQRPGVVPVDQVPSHDTKPQGSQNPGLPWLEGFGEGAVINQLQLCLTEVGLCSCGHEVPAKVHGKILYPAILLMQPKKAGRLDGIVGMLVHSPCCLLGS